MKRTIIVAAGVASCLLLLFALTAEAQQNAPMFVVPVPRPLVTYITAKVTSVESPCYTCELPTVKFSLTKGTDATKFYLYASSKAEDVQAVYEALLTGLSNSSQLNIIIGVPNLPSQGARLQPGTIIPGSNPESPIQVVSVAIEGEGIVPTSAQLPPLKYSEYEYVVAVVVREDGYLYVMPSGNFNTTITGCSNGAFGRSQYNIGDERTKAMMTEALASMLGKIKAGFWTRGCVNNDARGYTVILAIELISQ